MSLARAPTLEHHRAGNSTLVCFVPGKSICFFIWRAREVKICGTSYFDASFSMDRTSARAPPGRCIESFDKGARVNETCGGGVESFGRGEYWMPCFKTDDRSICSFVMWRGRGMPREKRLIGVGRLILFHFSTERPGTRTAQCCWRIIVCVLRGNTNIYEKVTYSPLLTYHGRYNGPSIRDSKLYGRTRADSSSSPGRLRI